MHPGRIGAAPNGISRTDKGGIIWANQVKKNNSVGYTWNNFRLGWSSELDAVYRPVSDNYCKWTCCDKKFDAVPCT